MRDWSIIARRWPDSTEWWCSVPLGGIGVRARAWRWGLAPWEMPRFADGPPPPTPEDRAAVSALEKRIDQVGRLISAGFEDNRVVAATRVNPQRAAMYADKIDLMRRHLEQIATALRAAAAVHGDLVDVRNAA